MNYPYPDDVLPRDLYISVVVPAYYRPFYLKKLLDTLAEHADMPYEVIVHDDGSSPELQQEIFEMRERISILSFNTGANQGLPAASNHCISQASSKYVLFLNDDCFFVQPCLRDISRILDKSYVGFLCPADTLGSLVDTPSIESRGTRFALYNHTGGGSCLAFRKEVWSEVGGWDERSTSGQADNVFLYKILKRGYWKAAMEGEDRIKVGNFVYGDDYKPTYEFTKGRDCHYPKIFGIDAEEQILLGHYHREACQKWVDKQRTIPDRETFDQYPNPVAGLNDIPYWKNYFLDIFGGGSDYTMRDIDWVMAERHNQSKWRHSIEEDING